MKLEEMRMSSSCSLFQNSGVQHSSLLGGGKGEFFFFFSEDAYKD